MNQVHMGVVKLFEGNRLRDAAPYFGGYSGIKFSPAPERYTITRIVLALPTGQELTVYPTMSEQMYGEHIEKGMRWIYRLPLLKWIAKGRMEGKG